MTLIRFVIALIGISFLTALPVRASLISFEISGYIDQIVEAEYQGVNEEGRDTWTSTFPSSSDRYPASVFSMGQSFSGAFTYDTEVSASFSPSGDGAQATYLGALKSAHLKVEEFTLPHGDFQNGPYGYVSIVNDRSLGILHDMFAIMQTFYSEDWAAVFRIHLHDRSATVFDSFILPFELNLADFSPVSWGLAFVDRNNQDQLHLSGTITNLRPVSVPEPSSVTLLVVGLLLLPVRHIASAIRRSIWHVQPL